MMNSNSEVSGATRYDMSSRTSSQVNWYVAQIAQAYYTCGALYLEIISTKAFP